MLNITLIPRQGKKMNRDEIRDSVLKVLGRVDSDAPNLYTVGEIVTVIDSLLNASNKSAD